MRPTALLLAPALAATLSAQAPEPGAPRGFRERALAQIATDPLDLWHKELREPVLTAVVEIVGEVTREEKQELAFLDMRTRLLAELSELLKGTEPMGGRGSGPAMFTLMRARY